MIFQKGDQVRIVGVRGGRPILSGKVEKLDKIYSGIDREMDYYIVVAEEIPNLRLRVRAWTMKKIKTDNIKVSWADMKHIWNPKGERNVDPIK